MVRYKIQ